MSLSEILGPLGIPGAALALMLIFLAGAKTWQTLAAGRGNGASLREAVRTLALVEAQQKDLEGLVVVVQDQQRMLREAGDVRAEQHELLRQLTTQVGRVASSLDQTVGKLTAITLDVEHTQRDLADHRVLSGEAMRQIKEIHSHVLRRAGERGNRE